MQYNPSSAGSDSSTLTVDEGAAGTDTFALSGTGVANRFIFTNQPGNPDFGNVAVGDTSGSKQITITNNTDYPDNPNVHLGGSDPGQFSESDDCTSNVGQLVHRHGQLPADVPGREVGEPPDRRRFVRLHGQRH